MLLEHRLHGLQIELRRQIHHCKVFLVEILVTLDAVTVALDEVVEQFDVRIHVTLEVHCHETRSAA